MATDGGVVGRFGEVLPEDVGPERRLGSLGGDYGKEKERKHIYWRGLSNFSPTLLG